jgi:hypothetical protein
MEEPKEMGTNGKLEGRNPDGTFANGHEVLPGAGRPKNTLKDFLRKKFREMTEEQKEEFLKKIPEELQFRMAEGNPAQDLTSGEEPIQTIPIYGAKSIQGHPSDSQDISAQKEN